jgi:hypothetical protein
LWWCADRLSDELNSPFARPQALVWYLAAWVPEVKGRGPRASAVSWVHRRLVLLVLPQKRRSEGGNGLNGKNPSCRYTALNPEEASLPPSLV